MANTAQARKRARQSENRRQLNTSQRSAMRTSIKKTLKLIQDKSKDAAQTSFRETSSLLDRFAGKKLIKANKASRLKHRINKKLVVLAKA